MSAQLTGELIERDAAARHDELMREFARGVRGMCVALHRIRDEETYRSRGFLSFKAFLASVGISETNGRRYASCGPALALLEAGESAELVRHPDMLRPIAGMLTSKQEPEKQARVAQRQASIVRLAAGVAARRQVPLDEAIIAEVAHRNFGWLSPEEYRRRKKGEPAPPTEAQQRKQMLEDLEAAFGMILHYKRTGYELVQELGDPHQWLGFDYAMQILKDAEDST